MMRKPWQHAHIRKRVLQEVLVAVFAQTNIPPWRILSRTKNPHVIAARDAVIRQLDAMNLYSMAEIGRAVGGRDHTTVRHALTKPRRLLPWRKPEIGHLRCRVSTCWCHIEPPPAPPPELEPEPPPRRAYLIPYAGAEYLTERSS